MKTFPPSKRRLLDRAQRRFIRSRPGSVLILVVALLVLMALIGTAFVSMAQSDRYAAEQHHANVQVDMLVDSVVEAAKNTLVSGLFANNAFRPSAETFDQTTGIGMDAEALNVVSRGVLPGNPLPSIGDMWLADRLPSVPNAFVAANLATNPPFWQYVTAPLTARQFDTPYWPGGPGLPEYYTRDLPLTAIGPIPAVPLVNGGGLNARMVPVSVTTPSGVYPALQMMDYENPPRAVGPAILAADADGDGIADSGLVKLPVGTIDGVTYYYGARIIDNGAAINANTAWTPNPYVTQPSPSGIPGDFFPVNIDLQGLLVNSREVYSSLSTSGWYLNLYRYGGVLPPGGVPVDEGGVAPRTDFGYMPFSPSGAGYYFDQVWMQLGRRLQNPGRPSANTSARFQAFGLGDAMALAYKFCLYDPSLIESRIEQALPLSAGWGRVRPDAYPANDSVDWFNQNFLFGPDSFSLPNQNANLNQNLVRNNMPLRSVLVTRNPVSNYCPVKFRDRGVWVSNPVLRYEFGDSVSDAAGTHRWVCIQPGTVIAPTYPPAVASPQGNDISPDDLYPTAVTGATLPSGWVYVPWATEPTKVDVNTASFGELWLAYWSVMCEQNPGSYVPAASPQTWPMSAMPILPASAPDFNGNPIDWRMFRSPIRSTAIKLHPYQVLMLRAAIAAVNTIDLRDNDDDVTSRTFTLPAIPASTSAPFSPAYTVTVYGTEMQPYITEVYANNKSSPTSGGYVAIELHNPYPKPIALRGFKLATLDRTTKVLQLIATDSSWDGGIIPPNGYLVAVSDPNPPVAGWPAVGSTATNPPAVILTVPALADATAGVFNKELVVLRPRRSCLSTTPPLNPPNGTYSSSVYPLNTNVPDPINNYNEGTAGAPLLYNLVPVDSYDFTGLLTPAASASNPTEWHYLRPNGLPGNKSWHCTYPGRYFTTYVAGERNPRQEGTMANSLGLTIQVSGQPSLATFGLPDALALPATYGVNSPGLPQTQQDVALQINNYDAAGPNNPSHAQATSGLAEPAAYPLGGFMRNGDILQVPFIGAYKISPLNSPTQIVELNSVTMDAAMATANNKAEFGTAPISVMTRNMGLGQPVIENVGRFCPIDGLDAGAVAGAPNDFAPSLPQTVTNLYGLNPQWRYHFANRLFDYLTVQSPQSDYTPEVDPYVYGIQYAGGRPGVVAKYPAANIASRWLPQPVANVTPGIRNAEPNNIAGADEEAAPVDGLVNVNTANWRVLAAVPWVPWNYGTATYTPTIPGMTTRGMAQMAIAFSIVRYRDYNDSSPVVAGRPPHGHGPFRNLFELGRVPLYNPTTGAYLGVPLRDALGQSVVINSHFDYRSGNLSPADGSSDNVFNDFESQYLMINRVSNLVTTRSDSFTVYLIVQGWRNAETANPTLAVQRRAAFIVDRSGVTPLNKSPNVTPVPTD